MKTKYTDIEGTKEHISKFMASVPVDNIVAKVCKLMTVNFKELYFKIVLLPSMQAVTDLRDDFYKNVPGFEHRDVFAFASSSRNTCFISVEDASKRVFAHEIVHVILNLVAPKLPVACHEILAQYYEERV